MGYGPFNQPAPKVYYLLVAGFFVKVLPMKRTILSQQPIKDMVAFWQKDETLCLPIIAQALIDVHYEDGGGVESEVDFIVFDVADDGTAIARELARQRSQSAFKAQGRDVYGGMMVFPCPHDIWSQLFYDLDKGTKAFVDYCLSDKDRSGTDASLAFDVYSIGYACQLLQSTPKNINDAIEKLGLQTSRINDVVHLTKNQVELVRRLRAQ